MNKKTPETYEKTKGRGIIRPKKSRRKNRETIKLNSFP
jgi:hypothetical protein